MELSYDIIDFVTGQYQQQNQVTIIIIIRTNESRCYFRWSCKIGGHEL